ncbi:hypothetical protein E2C01_049182 [Portunus trituberculatus]|uniref:Uncharacterized protein n=1 Tax=Portunus trituberculatus TaxID=210409 RepID=A0A5B7G4Y8_PORTR|nr:hypothetical protein [Portunus trituberculatus]
MNKKEHVAVEPCGENEVASRPFVVRLKNLKLESDLHKDRYQEKTQTMIYSVYGLRLCFTNFWNNPLSSAALPIPNSSHSCLNPRHEGRAGGGGDGKGGRVVSGIRKGRPRTSLS